eukprot:7347295-Prymnesium_polylepis.3
MLAAEIRNAALSGRSWCASKKRSSARMELPSLLDCSPSALSSSAVDICVLTLRVRDASEDPSLALLAWARSRRPPTMVPSYIPWWPI